VSARKYRNDQTIRYLLPCHCLCVFERSFLEHRVLRGLIIPVFSFALVSYSNKVSTKWELVHSRNLEMKGIFGRDGMHCPLSAWGTKLSNP
jgi:hypothetical protein